jgi:hypothetical protein
VTAFFRYKCPECDFEVTIPRKPDEFDTVTYCSGWVVVNIERGTMATDTTHERTVMIVIDAWQEGPNGIQPLD